METAHCEVKAYPSGLISPESPIDQPGAPVSINPVSSTFTPVELSPAQRNTQYCVFASRCTEPALNGAGRRPYFLTVYLFTPATGPSKVAPFFVGVAIWSLWLGRPFPLSPYRYTYTGSCSRLLFGLWLKVCGRSSCGVGNRLFPAYPNPGVPPEIRRVPHSPYHGEGVGEGKLEHPEPHDPGKVSPAITRGKPFESGYRRFSQASIRAEISSMLPVLIASRSV